MITQQGFRAKLKSRQEGAVAIIVVICLVVLIGMVGLVLDLGHLYVAKTELQNAADAAALSGAKELNGTKLGVQNAITAAANVARMNNFDFQKKSVGTNAADGGLVISVGSCPDDSGCGWVFASAVGTDADAVGKNFLKVETGNRNLNTWFAHVLPGVSSSTSTFGMAVAGRYVTPITPIGVCALRDTREAWVKYGSGANDEYKVEFGYMRGVNYDLNAINDKLSGLASGDKLYIHPTATSAADCKANEGSADFAAPFLCTGQSAIGNTFNSQVFTNTGLAAGKSIAAINTRFDLYGSQLDKSLDYTVCAPDANIKQYTPAVATNWMTATSTPLDQVAIYGLTDWLAGPVGGGLRSALTSVPPFMSVPPATLVAEKENKGGCGGDCSNNYGVLWSYTKPVKKSGNFTTDDWACLVSHLFCDVTGD